MHYLLLIILSCLPFSVSSENIIFSDETLTQDVKLPEWFKLSFLDLKDDITEAEEANKKGLILYFGRKDCPYCKALIEKNWGRDDIRFYTQKHFDVVAIDTKGIKSVTDFDGFVYDEKQYSLKMKTNFTPSLLFYSLDEKKVLRLTGYQNPYRFMAALEYVADSHYEKISYSDYLDQAEEFLETNGNEVLNNEPYFDNPPHNLNRKYFASERPLVVFFEKKYCHACDILHAMPLQDERVKKSLQDMDVIQVEINSSDPIVTPAGKKMTVSQWAKELDLNYSPTIIFFDESGKEIIRIDSVVWVNRLGRVLDYISSKSYKKYPDFQNWKLKTDK